MTFYLGIDVSSKTLDVAFFRAGEQTGACEQFDNSPAGAKKLLRVMARLDVQHVVLEATGGYENLILDAIAQIYTVTRIASHRGTAFVRSLGKFAKTDKADARALAHMAQTITPQPYKPPTPAQRHLRGLVKGRDQLIRQRDDNRRRIKRCESMVVQGALERVGALLTAEIKALEGLMAEAAKAADAPLAEQLLQVPGLGKIAVATLLAFLPELGQRGNRQISALVGVAPYTKQSGRRDGPRQIMAGRPFVRRILYMAALAAIRSTQSPLRAHYQALKARGKPPKVAIVACMRKLLITLNAMVRDQTQWHGTVEA
ncbi:IS110 family transposase [Xanthomonas sp. NCPPB 2632]|uniref:IS110 family transposase n=1 Tax=Xanthomonas sp. NCPPB 2632 TaxID=3240912 RepID=UPI003516749E